VVFVGTDASEVWTHSRQHNADVRHFFDRSFGRLEVTAGDVAAYADGDLGWSFDRSLFGLGDGTVLQVRLTFVWRREDEQWLVAHSPSWAPRTGLCIADRLPST
jgi:ketosteroid isomerase-like protein